MANPWYKEYSDFLAEHFTGKVQKISINTHSLCPNRDGTVGTGGCTYCNNGAFTPEYAACAGATAGKDVVEQILKGKEFFSGKYPEMKYLAYFQSYTPTHTGAVAFMNLVEAASSVEGIAGVVIGTRPDCLPDVLVAELANFAKRMPVIIELGAETSHDDTLQRVNRCHKWADTADAVQRLHAVGIPVGLHLILGLPGETTDDMLTTVDRINALPISTVKFHQLQIVRGTPMARDYAANPETFRLFDVDSYVDMCVRIVLKLRRDIAIDRFVSQSPDSMLIAPRWGLKNYQFAALLHKRLRGLAPVTQ